MSTDGNDEQSRQMVRAKINSLLSNSGLLEYQCPTSSCQTQIFATWEVDLTCERCRQKVISLYNFNKPWL